MKKLENVSYGSDPAQILDVYIPEGEVKGTLLFFHGGGLDHGTKDKVEEYMPLVDAGYAFASAEYRLMPKASYPDFVVDAAMACEYCHDHGEEWGITSEIFVSGASAGAWQIMMLCMDRAYLKDDSFVKGYISESAQVFAHYAILAQRGKDGRLELIDETAPIGYIREGLSVRPVVLMSYTDDIKCRPEENMLMFASMKKMMPEADVSYTVLEGTHLKPVRNEDRINAYLAFMNGRC